MKATFITILLFSKFFCYSMNAKDIPIKVQDDKIITIRFPKPHLDYIMSKIIKCPMDEAEPIVNNIREQALPQLQNDSSIKK